MDVKSTMYMGDEKIFECTWEIDDKARKTQKALAALDIEDYMRRQLKIEHKIITKEEAKEIEDAVKSTMDNTEVDDGSLRTTTEGKTNGSVKETACTETGLSCDCPVHGHPGEEHY